MIERWDSVVNGCPCEENEVTSLKDANEKIKWEQIFLGNLRGQGVELRGESIADDSQVSADVHEKETTGRRSCDQRLQAILAGQGWVYDHVISVTFHHLPFKAS